MDFLEVVIGMYDTLLNKLFVLAECFCAEGECFVTNLVRPRFVGARGPRGIVPLFRKYPILISKYLVHV